MRSNAGMANKQRDPPPSRHFGLDWLEHSFNPHDRKNTHKERNNQLRHIKKGIPSFDTSRSKSVVRLPSKMSKIVVRLPSKWSKILHDTSEGSNGV